jgi:lysozyme family protein
LPFTLKQEGAIPTIVYDSGGMTMEGTIQREYEPNARVQPANPKGEKISQDELHDIYFHQYQLPHCPNLPAGLDLSHRRSRGERKDA